MSYCNWGKASDVTQRYHDEEWGMAMSMRNEQRRNLLGREFVHFKGGHYRLEGFAKDSETLDEMVVYRALYGGHGLWVRPAKMFFETIERDGKTMKRFELVGPQ